MCCRQKLKGQKDTTLASFGLSYGCSLYMDTRMSITIRSLTGQSIPLRVKKAYTIEAAKQMVQDAGGAPPDDQRLIYAGHQLENKDRLVDYNIQDRSTMHLVLRLRGGE